MIRQTVILFALVAKILFLMGGCASPSLPMLQADRADVELSGNTFAVWHLPGRAETVRLTNDTDMSLQRNLALSMAAMEAVTGCTVRTRTLYGDRVMAEALLECPGVAPLPVQPTQTFGGLPRKPP
jgi:hypothetical protein